MNKTLQFTYFTLIHVISVQVGGKEEGWRGWEGRRGNSTILIHPVTLWKKV